MSETNVHDLILQTNRKAVRSASLINQFLILWKLRSQIGLLYGRFSIRTHKAEIELGITKWKSSGGDDLAILLIENVDVKDSYQGKGLFSGFCKKIMSIDEFDGIVYQYVINLRLAQSLMKTCILLDSGTGNNCPKFGCNSISNPPTFLELKREVMDLSTLELSTGE